MYLVNEKTNFKVSFLEEVNLKVLKISLRSTFPRKSNIIPNISLEEMKRKSNQRPA